MNHKTIIEPFKIKAVEPIRMTSREERFEILESKFVHRFGLSNAVKWLRDKCPPGRADLELLQSKALNAVWRHELEDAGIADYMYFVLKRAD